MSEFSRGFADRSKHIPPNSDTRTTMLLTRSLDGLPGRVPEPVRDRALFMAGRIDEATQKRKTDLSIRGLNRDTLTRALGQQDQAAAFFAEPHSTWERTPLVALAEKFNGLQVAADHPASRVLMTHLAERLLLQQELDPSAFAPHDTHHVLSVDRIAETILAEHPDILRQMAELYGITPAEARFCISMVNLFHDCGYPYTLMSERGQVGMLSKVTHSVFSADLLAVPSAKRSMGELISTSPAQRDKLLRDMYDAVFSHSSDVAKKAYEIRLTTNRGAFLVDQKNLASVLSIFVNPRMHPAGIKRHVQRIEVASPEAAEQVQRIIAGLAMNKQPKVQVIDVGQFIGRPVDLQQPRDTLAGLERRESDTATEPMRTVLILADNMHAGKDRRRGYEKKSRFFQVLLAIGGNTQTSRDLGVLEGMAARHQPPDVMREHIEQVLGEATPDLSKLNPEELIVFFKRHIIDVLIDSFADMSNAEKQLLKNQCYEQVRPNAFHVGGHLAIESVTIQGGKIVVRMSNTILPNLKASEQLHDRFGNISTVIIPVDRYVAWRMREAVRALRMNGRPIDVVLIDQTGREIPMEGDEIMTIFDEQ